MGRMQTKYSIALGLRSKYCPGGKFFLIYVTHKYIYGRIVQRDRQHVKWDIEDTSVALLPALNSCVSIWEQGALRNVRTLRK